MIAEDVLLYNYYSRPLLGDPHWLCENHCRPVVLLRLIITYGDFVHSIRNL